MKQDDVPEEAVVDATWFDPLGASVLLNALASREGGMVRAGSLTDFARNENFTSERMDRLVAAFISSGLACSADSGLVLAIGREDALRHAVVLRGVAYARYRHRDLNQVEITLSPPAYPSRLMEVLPKQGFSWARLYNTKDSLIELASQAQQRFTIVSPFLDDKGLEWIDRLFEASGRKAVDRTLIIRGRDERELEVLRSHEAKLASWGAKIMSYAISHDPELRTPTLETFHAKILIADSDKAYIGSANMNRWSRDFSMECGVIVRGPCVKPVATLVEAMIAIADRM